MTSDGRSRTPNDSDDDGSEENKRMKGLEDLGFKMPDPSCYNGVSNGIKVNRGQFCTPSLKRRTQVGHGNDLLKRKNRRRQLKKVLESAVMLSVPHECDYYSHDVFPERLHSSVDFSDSKMRSYSENNSNSDEAGVSHENSSSNICEYAYDCSYVIDHENKAHNYVWLVSDINNGAEKYDAPCQPERNISDIYTPKYPASKKRNKVDVLGSQSSGFNNAEAAESDFEPFEGFDPQNAAKSFDNSFRLKMNEGPSKWQSKGKRNIRSKTKTRDIRKYVCLDDKSNSFSSKKSDSQGDASKVASCSSSNQKMSTPFSFGPSNGITTSGLNLSSPAQKQLPYRRSRSLINSRYQSSYILGKTIQPQSKLYNVKLEVVAYNMQSHVSLRSTLYNEVIEGQAIPVVALEDGYCDELFLGCHVDADRCRRNVDIARARKCSKLMSLQSHYLRSKSSKFCRNGINSKKTRKLSSLTGGRICQKKPERMEANVECIPVKLVFSRIYEAVNRNY